VRPRLALLLGALLVPALPLLNAAPAHAAVNIICINRPDDADCGPRPTTIPEALSLAQNDGADSVIRIGPGTYVDGPYVFDGTVSPLTVQGSNNGTGPNATLLKGGAAAPYATATNVTIRNLRIEVSGSGAQGLALAGASSIAQNVIIADDPAAVATNAVGIRLEGAKLENTTVSLYRGAGNTGIREVSGPAVVSRVSVRASGTGVSAQGGSLAIDNSVLNLDVLGMTGLRADTGATVDARHLTVVGGAAGSQGVLASTTGAATAVALVNSIVRGPADSLAASGAAATLTVHHTDFQTNPPGSGTVIEGVGNLVGVDPAFIDPAFSGPGGGDLRLRAGSPLVDRGDPLTTTGGDRNGDGRAFDGDGNGSPVPDMGAYELRDITAPVTTFTARPPGVTHDNTPVFQFRSEDGARFECRLDGGAFQPCTSPTTTTPLPDGPHSLTVRATDRVFNVEANPPTAAVTVDTVAPDTRFTKKAPKRFFKQKVKFKFASSEAGTHFQCKIDRRAWRGCGSTSKFGVQRGKHTILVRAVDSAGNTDRSPARYTFKRLKRR
jgi:hypothetical protein